MNTHLHPTRHTDGGSAGVSPVEAAAVRQLLDQRYLAAGKPQPVRHGRRDIHARSVLLTDTARAQLRRWRALTPPTSPPPG
jgi:hypothetical protein